jgi:nitrite reductase (NADH) small subunit
MTATQAATMTWHLVCASSRLQTERGVTALVGVLQVALFRTFVYAVGNIDPFTGSAVLSRGLVGSRADRPTVASPLHKQVFDLETGQCLDQPAVSIPRYRVRVTDDGIEIGI